MRLSAPRLAISAAAVGAVAAATGIAVVASASGQSAPVSKTAAGDKTVVSAPVAQTITATDAQVQAYWTAARMKAAKEAPAPAAPNAGTGVGAAAVPADQGSPVTYGAAAPTASGDLSAQAKTVVNTKIWTKHGKAPAKQVGKVFFTRGGKNYSCSGTVVNTKNKRTVWTAGHCVHQGGNKNAGWDTNIVFVPDYYDGKAPYGKWSADHIFTTGQWFNSAAFAWDFGAFTLRAKSGKRIANVVGGQGTAFNYKGRTYNTWSFGYPADLLPSGKKINSNKLRYCYGKTFGARYPSGSVGMGLRCTMGHGASGGPWLYKPNKKGFGYVWGVNSTHSLKTNVMYSPYQGNVALALFKRAGNY